MSGRRRNIQQDEEDFTSEDDQQQQLDKSRLLRNLIWLVPVIFASLLLILGSLYIHTHLGTEHIHGARNVLARATENLKALPIVDVKAKAAAENCDTGFEELSLGKFGQIEGGCLCRDGTVHNKAYCALHAFSGECSLVKSVKEVSVKVFNTFKLCVKRNTVFKHNKDACSGDFNAAKCFTHYCIKTGEFCGFNKKESGDENAGTPAMLIEEDNNTRILSINHSHAAAAFSHADTATGVVVTSVAPYTANNIKIKYDSADQSMPYVGFEFITGDKLCWNNKLRDEKASKKSYALLEIKETGCGEFNSFDDVTPVIRNKLKYKTFFQKLNLESTLNNEKFFDTSYTDTDFVSLVAVRRITINANDNACYNINPDDIEKMDAQIDTLKNDLNGIFIAVVSIVSIMLLIAILFYVCKDKTYWHFDFRTRSSSKVLTILGVIAAILVIAGGIVYYVRETNIQKFETEYKTYVDKKCFDSYKESLVKALKTILAYAEDQHRDLANIAKASFYSGIAFLVVTVVLLVLKQKTGQPLFEGPFRND